MLSYEHQCHYEQGCFHRGISAPINYLRARVFWTKTPVLPINYHRARVFWTKTPVLPSTTLEQGCSDQRHQCSPSTTLGQGCSDHRHQCSPLITLGQGCSDQGHQCSNSIGLLILLGWIWMAPDVVPTRTIHHRFLILRNPSNLAMYLCLWCKDKSTWRQPIVYIVETGITVFEVN